MSDGASQESHQLDAMRYGLAFIVSLAALIALNTQYVPTNPYSPSTMLSGAVLVVAMIFTGVRAFMHWEEVHHA